MHTENVDKGGHTDPNTHQVPFLEVRVVDNELSEVVVADSAEAPGLGEGH